MSVKDGFQVASNFLESFQLSDFNKMQTKVGVDKARNMEHLGTFRNIPEHEKIKIFFYEKKIN